MGKRFITVDGNEAAALSAHMTNEVIAIYPITPASPMGEFSDAWSAQGRKNLWGVVPDVIEMQSEAGAAGACHGSIQAGALTTTFTASQGLLLMIPNMFKIAGELSPTVFHIAARSVATHALSIFGDHSDVMAARSTGWAMLAAGSIQQIHDFALIAQAASLESRVPFLHFFDGFRSSHELNKIEALETEHFRRMIDEDLVSAFRDRALNPDRPVLRGTAQNPDVFFQAREACNPFYDAVPAIFEKTLEKFAQLTGRKYDLFEYVGHPEAERVVLLMGSGVGAAEEAVQKLAQQGEKVGALKIHLYRPFSVKHFLDALPATTKSIAALDRTKEPGAIGEPLYLDAVSALAQSWKSLKGTEIPSVIGGRYGLSSKEFTPAMVKAVLDELAKDEPKHGFTVGIYDDVTHLSLKWDDSFSTEEDDVTRAVFFGLGSDGTVGANKNSVKIIGEGTDLYAQGYFVYDSKKAGSQTSSHLRFGPRPIQSTYLINTANFVACHQFGFLERTDMLSLAAKGATFLTDSPYGPDEIWDHLPVEVQQQIIDKELKFYVIDASRVAREVGMGGRINTIMQTCFFALSGILPRDEAIDRIKKAIEKSYGRRGEKVLQMNMAAVDQSLENLHEVKIPAQASSTLHRQEGVSEKAPDFVQKVTSLMMAGKGDLLPVSAMPVDGTFITGTTKWEKRSIAHEIPIWDGDLCIQCGLCALVCPHSAIRSKVYEKSALGGAPDGFESRDYRGKEYPDQLFTIQVAPDDCTGCGVCVDVCPAKSKENVSHKAINMEVKGEHLEREQKCWDFFLELPEMDRSDVKLATVKGSQLLEPLFEFSGACAGCGETPYVKLLTQLFGDRALIANATGCSSIYGGNLPTTPYSQNADGRGPAWSNSLFEDNAEFGLGMGLARDQQRTYARFLLGELRDKVGAELSDALLASTMETEAELAAQRARVAEARAILEKIDDPRAQGLARIVDVMTARSVWIVGGDGWAYDIGFGGLDHVLASGRNVNLLVLDTEVYSNTGGQASKATPRGAVAKFAAGGKPIGKKDLGMIAMAYGNVYVGQVAMGANPAQTVRTFLEAEAYDGPSIIIAYSHCIAHGIDMSTPMSHQKEAVNSGFWPLYHYDPRKAGEGQHPFHLDSKKPKIPYREFAMKEARFAMLKRSNPEAFESLADMAQEEINDRWHLYEQMADVERVIPATPKES